MKKPPLGITPKYIWERKIKEERLHDLLAAMDRYEKEGLRIPIEWNREYLELTTELELYKGLGDPK